MLYTGTGNALNMANNSARAAEKSAVDYELNRMGPPGATCGAGPL
jgi:hypothetical protein